MTTDQLDFALSRYKAALDVIEKGEKNLSAKAVLCVLMARDAVQSALTDTRQIPEEKVIQVVELDNRVREQGKRIVQTVNLADLRAIFKPPEDAWWWFLPEPLHRLDVVDWLWNGLTITSLTASLSLLVDISNRFLSGGLDLVGSFAVIFPSISALLTVGGVLTKAGSQGIEQVLAKLRIDNHLWQEIKFGFSLLLLLSLIGFRYRLPSISDYFNHQGFENYKNSNWGSAKSDYERSISLNPDNAEAHYNLGRLYEQLQEIDKAETQYKFAVGGDFGTAHSALARLYIQKKKYAEAVLLLYRGLELVRAENKKTRKENKKLLYELHKNLGWVRVEQKRYADARTALESAITIEKSISLDEVTGSAHCLLAQALEENRKSTPEKALPEWELCIAYGTPRSPEEDKWFDLANQRLKAKGAK